MAKEIHLELRAGLETKFWLWMTKYGYYSNLQVELKYYNLKYDDMIDAMYWSYVDDHYKNAWFRPFTSFLLFNRRKESMYGKKYWEDIQVEWKRYAKGEVAT